MPRTKRSNEELQDKLEHVDYITESFTFEAKRRNRPKQVTKMIAVRDGVRESEELTPLCCISHGTHEDTPAPYAAGGHLIASILSGPNDPKNLVPVSKRFNDQMEKIEKEIRNFISKEEEIKDPVLTVTVDNYYEQDGRIPRTVTYKLKYKKLNFTGNFIDAPVMEDELAKKLRPRPRAQIREVTETEETKEWEIVQDWLVVCDSNKRHVHLKAFLDRLKAGMPRDWKVEDLIDYTDLVSDDMKKIPADKRPYAVLDYWFLVKDGKDYKPEIYTLFAARYKGGIGRGCEFTQEQKDLILRLQYAYNEGYLKSDVFGRKDDKGVVVDEPHQTLIKGAAGSGPSFDHICPVRKNGSNLFSNCQVTSIAFNSRKGSKF
jgi:hypothetical protein